MYLFSIASFFISLLMMMVIDLIFSTKMLRFTGDFFAFNSSESIYFTMIFILSFLSIAFFVFRKSNLKQKGDL